MAETHRFVCAKPARLIFSSVTTKSAPKNVQGAIPKFGGTFGLEEEDFKACVDIMVRAIKGELGSFGSPGDYFLACQSGKTAAKRALDTAEFQSQGKPADERQKIMEKAESRAALYTPFAGILSASSQYDVELARLDAGKVVDIANNEIARAQAGKDLFYPGAYVAPSVAFKAFRRKTLEAKDGCTSYLQNCLFIRKGEKLAGGSGPANNEVFGNFAGYSDYDPLANAPSSEDPGAGMSEKDAF